MFASIMGKLMFTETTSVFEGLGTPRMSAFVWVCICVMDKVVVHLRLKWEYIPTHFAFVSISQFRIEGLVVVFFHHAVFLFYKGCMVYYVFGMVHTAHLEQSITVTVCAIHPYPPCAGYHVFHRPIIITLSGYLSG